MTDYGKRIKEKIDVVTLSREDFNTVCKDRLDFGFDSIYFRYSEAIDELAAYKALVNHSDPVKERQHLSHRKMHFYNALEQLVHAHDQEEDK
jgi:hypothetical protein